jgi:hypothetical protein
MNLDYKLDRFNMLTNNYIDTINSLLDLAVSNKIVPFKLLIGLPLIKDYIQTNRIDLLEYGVQYILSNKSDIMNFDINRLDELDSDSDDNISRKEYINNIDNAKVKINNKINIGTNYNSNEIIDIIVQIKNNSKNLDNFTVQMIRNYFELLILILEQIKSLY